jgi:hypothetical protein
MALSGCASPRGAASINGGSPSLRQFQTAYAASDSSYEKRRIALDVIDSELIRSQADAASVFGQDCACSESIDHKVGTKFCVVDFDRSAGPGRWVMVIYFLRDRVYFAECSNNTM